MSDSMDIKDVVRRTGLSSRALRFYEAKGLIAPLRTYAGRRMFGPAELLRLHQIVVLKSAGISLAQIKNLLDGKPIDFSAMLSAQLKMLEEEAARNAKAQSLIHYTLSRAGSDPVDMEVFCQLIESGDKMMNQEPKEWAEVTNRYFTPAEKAQWAEKMAAMPSDFDYEAYGAEWKKLGDEIKAALPLSADSDAAQAFVGRWYDLLKPMAQVYSPEMWNGAVRLYDRMDEWAGSGAGQPDPGFDKQVWDFMKLATAARLASGGKIAPLAPEYWGEHTNREGQS